MQETIVVKIGGSTLGSHDTTMADIAALWSAGTPIVVIHGGGPEITRWLATHNVESHFVNGLRVTDEPALEIVVAVLAGVINKQLVAQFAALGVRAAGLSGADGGLVDAAVEDPAYGFVGAVRSVDPTLIRSLLAAGFLPVIAPVAMDLRHAQLLNVNGDTVAGEIAAALPGSRLVFLTDVAGVLDGDGSLVERLTPARSAELRVTGVLKGGMLPKIDACFRAAQAGGTPVIVDGRRPNALAAAVGPSPAGTVVG
ncbi:MAG: acetylglutamate kinase [Dehalococcoidia bacterium]